MFPFKVYVLKTSPDRPACSHILSRQSETGREPLTASGAVAGGHYDEQVCDGKMGENKKQYGLRGGTGDKRVVPALLPEAMVMSMTVLPP